MSKTKLLTILVIVLALINIVAMSAFFMGGKRAHREGPKKMVIHQLDLDQTQIEKYEALIQDHRLKIKDKEEGKRLAKQELFNLLQKESYSERDQLVDQIAQLQTEIENIHFQHFADLKKICRPDQIEKFNALTDDLARILSPHNRKNFKPKH